MGILTKGDRLVDTAVLDTSCLILSHFSDRVGGDIVLSGDEVYERR